MGCGPSTLAIVELNRCLKNDGAQGLQGKLLTSPWLLSVATPVISSTAGTALHAACERKQVQVRDFALLIDEVAAPSFH